MKTKSRVIPVVFSLLLLSVLLFSCSTTREQAVETAQEPEQKMEEAAGPPPESFQLTIVETTDVHGAIFPWDFMKDKPAKTSLAQVQTYLKELHGKGGEVLLLDNGDILQGQPIVYYSNFVATDVPHATTQVMNYMGYHAGTVGNHDIEAGHPVYDKLVNEYDFPWLAANAIDTKTGKPYFPPYAVFNHHGAKIVVFGLCTPGIPTWLPEDIWEGIEFRDMIETSREWIPVILDREDPDLLVGLFHAGTDFTYSGYDADSPLNPNAAQLVAEQVPGFDIIFVGHDHQGHNEVVTNTAGDEVLILGALNAARTVAVADVQFSYNPADDTFTTGIAGSVVSIEAFEADPDFMTTFDPLFNEVRSWVSQPIGNFTRTISSKPALFEDTPFVDLIHRIQLELTGADVSFAAPLSSSAEIQKGEIYVRDMFSLYRYENLLYTMSMTGQEIKDFLEYSYGGWFGTMASPEDHLIRFKRDDDGKLIWNDRYSSYDTYTRYYNYDSAAGIDYIVDVSKPQGKRITITSFSDGRPFKPDMTYKVAINSYRGNGGGGHLSKGAGIDPSEFPLRTLSSTIQDLRYYLMTWIMEQETVTPAAFGNWTVEPAAWWKKASKRDYAIIYEGARE